MEYRARTAILNHPAWPSGIEAAALIVNAGPGRGVVAVTCANDARPLTVVISFAGWPGMSKRIGKSTLWRLRALKLREMRRAGWTRSTAPR